MHTKDEKVSTTKATSRSSAGLGPCRLLDVSLRAINTIETMDNEIQIMFTFTDNAETKFGNETVQINTDGTKQYYIRLCYGSDMRDVALGLTRLAGHIATVISPMTTA